MIQRWPSRCRSPKTDPTHTHTQPPTCMNQICWQGSEGSEGPRALRVLGWAQPGWIHSSVCLCVVTFSDGLPARPASPWAFSPLRHDLSLYSSRAASAERVDQRDSHTHCLYTHIKLLLTLRFCFLKLQYLTIKPPADLTELYIYIYIK